MADAAAAFSRIDLKTHALLFDVDGTLLDFADDPELVVVPGELIEDLKRLHQRAGGAVAFVSGRQISVLDRLFTPLQLPAVGGHGAEFRDGSLKIQQRVPDLPLAMRERLRKEGLAIGIEPKKLEDKLYSFALHYRIAPHLKEAVSDIVQRVRAEFPQVETGLQTGSNVLELRHPNARKELGSRELLRRAPFAGRIPVFVGDDDTDMALLKGMPDLSGIGFSVKRALEGVSGIFPDPAAFRAALRALAQS